MEPETALRALRVILPDDVGTLLLRACLGPQDETMESWQTWVLRVGDPKRAFELDRGGLKRLLPLAEASVRTSPTAVSPEFRTYLRVSLLREELRGQIIRRIYRETLEALRAAGVDPITLGGFALAEIVYAEPARRHCHGLDLLIDDDEFATARQVVRTLGFSAVDPQGSGFRHEAGLPLQLHRSVGHAPCYLPSAEAIRGRTEDRSVAGAESRVLSLADQLLNTTIYGASDANRANLQWVCDLWHSVDAAAGPDWELLLSSAREGATALPLHLSLEYLATRLGAQVPTEVLAATRELALTVDPVDCEAAVIAGVADASGARRILLDSTIPLRDRLEVARTLAVPSVAYLRLLSHERRGTPLALLYLLRPARYAASRLSVRLAELRARGRRTN